MEQACWPTCAASAATRPREKGDTMATILLVEDNEMNRDALARHLRRRGFEVITAVSEVKGRILIVDDAEMNRDALSRRLQRSGFEVEQADHGSKVMPALQATPFDMVLLDIMMPDIDGLQVLTQVRERYSMADLP